MKNVYIFLLLVFTFNSCCIFNKTKTETRVERIVEIDTVIIVQKDSIPIIKTGYLHDTIIVENKTSIVKAYFDIATNKIVVRLSGKPFTVPIKIKEHTITVTKIVELKKKTSWLFYFILGAGSVIILYLSIKRLKQ